MVHSFITHCIHIIFIIVLNNVDFSYNQDVNLLNETKSWGDANNSCNLTELVGDATVLQQGQRAWTGKRTMFTNWIALEDCTNYQLDQTKSTTVTIDGAYSVRRCYNECKKLFITNDNPRFGLKFQSGTDICACDIPQKIPNFGILVGKCDNLIDCQSNVAEDLCGSGGFLLYRSDSTASLKGSGECGAFNRTGNGSFQGLALPCSERFGSLLRDNTSNTYSINRTISTWREKVFSEGVGPEYPRLSNRVRPHTTVWKTIPLNEWPVNVMLWVAVTRRKMNLQKQDSSPCNAETCFCVAIHREGSTLEEELLDCNTELPSICVRGSITTTSTTYPTVVTSTTSKSTTSEVTTPNITLSTLSETTRTEAIFSTQHDIVVSSTISSSQNFDTNPSTTRTTGPPSSIISTLTEFAFNNTPKNQILDAEPKTDGILIPVTVSALVGVLVVVIITIVIVFKRRAGRRQKEETKPYEEPAMQYSEVMKNNKENYEQKKTDKVIGPSVLPYDLARQNEDVGKKTGKDSAPDDTYDTTNRKGEDNSKQYYTTAEAAKENSNIYDHTTRKDNRNGEINDNEYGVVKSERADIYDHTQSVLKAGSNCEINDNEYGVVKSESGYIYDHTRQSTDQAKVDESNNYDTMAGVRRDETNIYDHSHPKVDIINDKDIYG